MDIKTFLKAIDILEQNLDSSPALTLQNSYKRNPYTILMVTLLSLRSRDSQTATIANKLFNSIQTPEELLEISQDELEAIIKPLGMQKKRAKTLIEVSKTLIEKFDSKVPESKKELLSIKGIGEKTANVVLNSAFNQNIIAVDTHIHRICNIWKVVETKNEIESSKILNRIIPKSYRAKLNTILVSFGQTICLPNYPKCEICKVKEFCKRN